MRARTIGWVAVSAAAASAALIIGAVVLAYVDRHRVHGRLTSWDFSDVFANVTSLAVPVVGFVLASRRPANRLGWLERQPSSEYNQRNPKRIRPEQVG